MKAIKCTRCGEYQSPVGESPHLYYPDKTSAKCTVNEDDRIVTKWVDLCEKCTKEFLEDFVGRSE